MLKGVNKLIVEVSNPNSEFFERAIFFVKPQMKNTPTGELNKSADKLLMEAGRLKGKRKFFGALRFVGAAGLGAAAAMLIKFLV